MSEFNHPPLNQDALWNRNVEGEEQHNNVENVNRAMVDIIRTTAHAKELGKPLIHVFDDLDADQPVAIEMDDEWKRMVLFGIGRERQHLEKKGIIIDFRPQPGREGDDTT
jgi:hypothetical protein